MDTSSTPLPPLLLYGEQGTLMTVPPAAEKDLGKFYQPSSQMLPAKVYADGGTFDRLSSGGKDRRIDKVRVD